MADGQRAGDWGEGYVTDVEYVDSFHADMAPLDLAFAAWQAGACPPDVDRPFAYLDLGCGNGFTPALIAAGHPHARVWGTDFNPAHIRNAQATADAAGIGNATFRCASFADMADAELPPFDFVVLHGIWSWVNAANRERVAALLDAHVKPGGLVMISYNCHPGWDALLPLRRLLSSSGGPDATVGERIEQGLAMARALRDANAGYFRDNPGAGEALDQLAQADRAYLAHEFCNANWSLFTPAEVAAEVASTGLRYLGQARAIDNIDRLWQTAEQQALLDAEPGTAARETLRDLILNRRFRHDLFVRGGEPLDADARAAWLGQRRFALAKPRSDCSLTVDMRVGALPLPAMLYEPLLDTLAKGPATGAALGTGSDPDVTQALTALVAIGYVRPALAEAGEPTRRAAAERFNAAMLDRTRMGEPVSVLASPVTGTGHTMTSGDQLLLDAYRSGIPLEMMSFGGDGADVDPVQRFREQRLPVLSHLGIA